MTTLELSEAEARYLLDLLAKESRRLRTSNGRFHTRRPSELVSLLGKFGADSRKPDELPVG
jgi:hypothetical protein